MNATEPVQSFFPDDIPPLGEVLEYVINAKMTCLFADWLSRHGHTQRFPRPMQQFLRGQLRLNAYRSRKHHQEAAAIIAALHDHDVPAAAINGIMQCKRQQSGYAWKEGSVTSYGLGRRKRPWTRPGRDARRAFDCLVIGRSMRSWATDCDFGN